MISVGLVIEVVDNLIYWFNMFEVCESITVWLRLYNQIPSAKLSSNVMRILYNIQEHNI